jgi:3-methyladenine DNA glycosylase/8-oxoguanine DNA glycosylase
VLPFGMSSLPMGGPVVIERVWRPPFPLDVRLTLATLRMGSSDPCHRLGEDGALWRTANMTSGPVTYRLRQGDGTVSAAAWGLGAPELIDGLPRLLGSEDSPESFEARHPLLAAAHRRHRGWRVPSTGRVVDALAGAALHQKVNGRDAGASWSQLVRRHGSPAPGPAEGMRVPPTPEQWLSVPAWDWRRAGVEPAAIRTIRLVASRAAALDRAASVSREDAYRAMLSLPGVGRWTAAEVGCRALGDADALPVGDYHLASLTGHALAGRELAEQEVEAFYEQWRPQRYRAFHLLELTPSAWPPRRGARMARPEHRHGW